MAEVFERFGFVEFAVLAQRVVTGNAVLSATADVDGHEIVAPRLAVFVRGLEQTMVNLMGEIRIVGETVIVQRTAQDGIETVVLHARSTEMAERTIGAFAYS